LAKNSGLIKFKVPLCLAFVICEGYRVIFWELKIISLAGFILALRVDILRGELQNSRKM
jgi:hypothetical protein